MGIDGGAFLMARKPAPKPKPRKAKAGAERAMSEQEALFLKHYLADQERNGTKAAIAAGYAEASARFQASRLLKRNNIAQHVARADAKAEAAVARVEGRIANLIERRGLSKERAMELLAIMANGDVRDILEFGPDVHVATMETGEQITGSGVRIRASQDLEVEAALCIQEVKQTRDGIAVKLYDRRAALMDFAKLAGWIVEKQEHDIPALTAVMETIRGAVSRSSQFPIGDAARRARTIEHSASPAVPHPAKGQTA